MLKIEIVTDAGAGATIRLAGRVGGPWVEELARACGDVLETEAPLTLDLSQVSFVDQDGVRLLRALRRRGVTTVRGSGFVEAQLAGGGTR